MGTEQLRRRVCGGVSGLVLGVALLGCVTGVGESRGSAAAAPLAASADAAPAAKDSPAGRASAAAARPMAASTPVSLAIPAIKLQAPLLALGLDRSGAVETPPFTMPGTAAWFRDSPAPGAVGASVIVGHVDTPTGPAVFWNLAGLRPGAAVSVSRLDGRSAVFTVDRVQEFPKSAFPARAVYAPAVGGPAAELRLVTCGGAFDRARREYSGNVVVFAHLAAVR